MSKRVLIFGRRGQVAKELGRVKWPFRDECLFVDRRKIDFLDVTADDLEALWQSFDPDIAINAAAYTAVDRAEREPDHAFAINAAGPQLIAETCARHETPLIHISTDYVFDGKKAEPYTEDDPINPLSVYGASKADGEKAIRSAHPQHVILRTAWVYSAFGNNFVKSMLRLGAEREELTIVDDQTGCPTSAAEIAAAIRRIAGMILVDPPSAPYGTYHYVGAERMTWFGFARAIFKEAEAMGAKAPAILSPITTADYPTEAVRPANSVLETARIGQVWGVEAPPQAAERRAVLRALIPREN